MECLARFSRLPATEQRLLIKAVLLVEAIKLGMRLLPFRTLRRLLGRAADRPLVVRHADRSTSAERVACAVEVAADTPGTRPALHKPWPRRCCSPGVLILRCFTSVWPSEIGSSSRPTPG
jgi:hypothetical protein